MMCGEARVDLSLRVVFASYYSPICVFCNGNQRSILRIHVQLSANCLRGEISKDSYRAAVMSPKLEMSTVVQRLFYISSPLPPLCQGTLLNHPSTLQTCHSHCAPLQAASSRCPHLPLFTLWCILQKLAYLECRRAVWQNPPLLPHCLPSVINSTSPKQKLPLTLIS